MERLLLREYLRRHGLHRRDKLALADDHGTANYGELWEAIEGVAAAFIGLGIRPGERVGFALQPSIAHVALLLGCMASGAIPVFLNIRLTAAELAAFLEPIKPVRIICDRPHEKVVSVLGVETIVMDDLTREGRLSDRLKPLHVAPVALPDIDEAATALIVPTGGTTGAPKGAMISHRSMCLWLQNAGAAKIRRLDDLELYYAPFFHVSLVTYCFTALYYGGAIRVLPRFSAERLLELTIAGGTHLNGTPTTFTAMRELPEFRSANLAHVREVGFGAMAATEDFMRQIGRDFPNARLRHAYGSTEVGTVTLMSHEDFLEGRTTGVGRPMAGVRFTVVDDDMRPLPVGAIGELIVDCPWATSGYWGREAETRATLTELGVRTGDLGSIDAQGWVTIHGRKKEMIISGGENVFPNEVESVLCAHPAVQAMSVYGAADKYWGERVEAAVVLRPGASLTLEELTSFGRAALAGYKLPKVLRIVDEIPLTPANKPDRRRLRQLAEASSD